MLDAQQLPTDSIAVRSATVRSAIMRSAVAVAIVLWAVELVLTPSESPRLPPRLLAPVAGTVLLLAVALTTTFVLAQFTAAGRRPVPIPQWRFYDAWIVILVLTGGPILSWNELIEAAGFPELAMRHARAGRVHLVLLLWRWVTVVRAYRRDYRLGRVG